MHTLALLISLKDLEERQSEQAGFIHTLMQEPAAGTVLFVSFAHGKM